MLTNLLLLLYVISLSGMWVFFVSIFFMGCHLILLQKQQHWRVWIGLVRMSSSLGAITPVNSKRVRSNKTMEVRRVSDTKQEKKDFILDSCREIVNSVNNKQLFIVTIRQVKKISNIFHFLSIISDQFILFIYLFIYLFFECLYKKLRRIKGLSYLENY